MLLCHFRFLYLEYSRLLLFLYTLYYDSALYFPFPFQWVCSCIPPYYCKWLDRNALPIPNLPSNTDCTSNSSLQLMLNYIKQLFFPPSLCWISILSTHSAPKFRKLFNEHVNTYTNCYLIDSFFPSYLKPPFCFNHTPAF